MKLAVDLMGGESSPQQLYEGLTQGIKSLPQVQSVTALATPEVISSLPKERSETLVLHPVEDVVAMEDSPLKAAKCKKGSNLHHGLKLVKNKEADAFITTGNTGALIAAAVLTLEMLPDINRPALLTLLPTVSRPVVVVDVGGILACKPQYLVQFAQMGAAFHRCLFSNPSPKVGLLNIGTEPHKGPPYLQESYVRLQESRLEFSFIGNVEGKEVFKGDIDVLVTDAFTGNVFLKAAEGASAFALQRCLSILNDSGVDLPPAAQTEIQKQLDHGEYPGAFLCGVDGIVLKCHGSSCARSVFQSMKEAASLVEKNIIAKLLK